MNDLILLLTELITKVFSLDIGYIISIDADNGTCSVKTSNLQTVTCPLVLQNGYSDLSSQAVWGEFSLPTVGSFVFIIYENGRPSIISPYLGYKNFEKIYSDGKLKINRIADAEDSTLTAETKLLSGEKLLRSIKFGDLFFDKLGNILFDFSKEIVLRCGPRDSNNIISSPEMMVRIGKVKDTNGNEKIDGDGEKIKIDVDSNITNKLTLNEIGKWRIENSNGSITIKSDGIVIHNDGARLVARKEDETISDNSLDPAFWSWVTSVNNFCTAVSAALGIPFGVKPPTELKGKINEGNTKFLCSND